MHKGRFEAFTDAVIAIIMTIMVLELRPPAHGADFQELCQTVGPQLVAYALSFLNLGIYWSNHHPMLQAVKSVNGAVLWANLHLLFWLSLIPFTTAWVGGNQSAIPVAVYGGVLLLSGTAYYILERTLIGANGKESAFAGALKQHFKDRMSVLIYLIGVGLAFVQPYISIALYITVALMWLIPDRRFAKAAD